MNQTGLFQGEMIASDIDGTILPYLGRVSDRNRAAIRFFSEQGGVFTLSTGRSIIATRPIARDLGLTVPLVVNNGSLLYNPATDEIVQKTDLDPSAHALIAAVLERFPEAGVEVYSDREFYVLQENAHIRAHVEGVEATPWSSALVRKGDFRPWQKALIAADPEVSTQVLAYLETLPRHNIHLVRSSVHYVELVPVDATKGEGTLRLAALLGVSREHVYTAGDYNNDIELIDAGAISFAPSNALESIRQRADVVVGDCADGVVADIVEYLLRERGLEACIPASLRCAQG